MSTIGSKRKEDKKNKKKQISSSSSSSSVSSSSSSGSSNPSQKDSLVNYKYRRDKYRKRSRSPKRPPVEQLISNATEIQPRVFRVNKFALGSMLFENRVTNERMDRLEVEKSNKELQKVDKTGRQAQLMSSHLNKKQEKDEDRDAQSNNNNNNRFQIEVIEGQYIKVYKPYQCSFNVCGLRFKLSTELTAHLNKHQQSEQQKNNQKAMQFLANL